MHFIVTGGAGFIGSHLTEQLLSKDHQVTVVDNLSTGSLQNLPEHSGLKFIQKDILTCQPEEFTTPINGIAHLAATPSVTESWLSPLKTHNNNLSTTVAVIELCQALNIPRVVFASSAAVYGNQMQLPISEDQKTSPIAPYGLQKLVSEQYLQLFAQQLGLSFIALRLFNVFGPRQLPNSPYSGVISIFTKAMQNNLPLTIYGDGQQSRDFIYVKDVANAFATSLTLSLPNKFSQVCNVGTSKTTSLIELVNILKLCFPDWNAETLFATARSGDIQHSQADISRIFSFLHFQPQWSVDAGLRSLVEYLN